MKTRDLLPELAKLTLHKAPLRERPAKVRHLLVVLPAGESWFDVPDLPHLQAALERKALKPGELANKPLIVELQGGCLSAWVRLDAGRPVFQWLSLLRQALKPLLDEHPEAVHVALHGEPTFRQQAARCAAYVAWLNGAPLPSLKSEDKPPRPLARIHLHAVDALDLTRERAIAEGNTLARRLTWLPPNLLTPASYRAHIRELAKTFGWDLEEYDVKRLRRLKAGAFLAVARGSQHEEAAIVRLAYPGQGGKAKGGQVALVGKGICFDTGGHNLKPARYMHNMHDDMNGSAVVLGILLAATRLKLPLSIEAWLAIAQNHLSPEAYTQNEVVTALNGKSIEIVHTDAEGRMVLADTLTLAARNKPEVILDFATLTGSMAVALGSRMSGILANRTELASQAVAVGEAVGERVVAFPVPEDYDEALESQLADVKQCILEGEADHILAARFLSRFVDDRPWLHMDLSASRCKGGLGAVATDITGFGVAWGVEWLLRQSRPNMR
ncbi:MAG: M17 family metallopeptidase [Thiobacillaceae bacterium]